MNLPLVLKFVNARASTMVAIRTSVPWMQVVVSLSVLSFLLYLFLAFVPLQLLLPFSRGILCTIAMVWLTLLAQGVTALFPAGYMWNRIRGGYFFAQGDKGQHVIFEHGGAQSLSETFAIMLLSILLVFISDSGMAIFFIGLMVAPKAGKRFVDVISLVSIVGVVVLFSMEVFLYTSFKNSGYPFKILF